MNLRMLVLGSASLGGAAIGFGYLVAPNAVLGLYGIGIQSVSEANIVRSACGGIFLAFSVLFGLGALKDSYKRAGLIALLTFMGGLALGRAVSFIADGTPHLLLVGVFVVEIAYVSASGYLLAQEHGRPYCVASTG